PPRRTAGPPAQRAVRPAARRPGSADPPQLLRPARRLPLPAAGGRRRPRPPHRTPAAASGGRNGDHLSGKVPARRLSDAAAAELLPARPLRRRRLAAPPQPAATLKLLRIPSAGERLRTGRRR